MDISQFIHTRKSISGDDSFDDDAGRGRRHGSRSRK
jgi:hypothetical protein